jgi:chaperonin GroES
MPLTNGNQTRSRIDRRRNLKGEYWIMARLNIKPLGDKVIVKRLEAEAKTAGGIVLPDTAKEKPKRGIVLAIGNGKLLDDGTRGEMQVKKDDEVLFTSYAGTEIKVNGEDYMIMDESDILGVVG